MQIPEKHISFSRLELVTQCPAKFKHRYITESKAIVDSTSPALLGSVVHKVLEKVYPILKSEGYNGPLLKRIDLFSEHLSAIMREAEYPVELFPSAQQMLKEFAMSETCQSDIMLAVEQQFVFEPDVLGEVTILGYIDRIDRPDAKTICLIDYKSNRMLFTAEELRQSLQASIYIMAAMEMFPEAEHFEMRFQMLRHGIQQRTLRSEADLAEAKDYILLIADKIRRIEEGGAAVEILNKYCPWCEYRRLCAAYKDACENKNPLTKNNPNDIAAIAEEYEDISARAKIMYARKEELADLLKIKLIGQDRLTAGGHNYSLGKTTVTNFTDVAQVIHLLANAAGLDHRQVLRQIGNIAKGKYEELLSSLKTVLPANDYFRLETNLEALMEQEYQPRLQSTVIRKNQT